MAEYEIHIFDVDNKGCIIPSSMQVTIAHFNTDKEAIELSEKLRQERNIKEPLPINAEWGKVEYLSHVWKGDDCIY